MSRELLTQARILIVDDHPVVRLGIRQMIAGDAGLSICGEADSAESAVGLVKSAHPDLAIIDLSLGRGTGLDLIRLLHESVPDLPMLVLSMHDEALFAERVLRAGARGYIMKQQAIAGLVEAIRQVLAGRIYLSERMAQSVLERLGHDSPQPGGRLGNLTDRELEVFNLIGHGASTTDIARQLNLSIKTIETYRANIKSKLDLKDAADVIRYATSWVERL